MKSTLAAIVLVATSITAMAQGTPVGLWRNVDDKSGEVKAEIRIGETNGALLGRIEKSLRRDAKPDAVCDECSDDRKGKPITGLDIIRGGKKAEGKDVWEGGKILDPENGKEYRASFTPIDGGRSWKCAATSAPSGAPKPGHERSDHL